jgi:predicted nucleic acid-binding protein
MSDLVVDSSVAVKWVLPEDDSNRARQLREDVVRSGGRLFTLDLTYVEVANAIWKRFHRGLQSDPESREVMDVFGRLDLHVRPVSGVLSAGLDIALRYDRAVYDACFVALVAELGADGITADEPLFKAINVAFPRIKLLKNC